MLFIVNGPVLNKNIYIPTQQQQWKYDTLHNNATKHSPGKKDEMITLFCISNRSKSP